MPTFGCAMSRMVFCSKFKKELPGLDRVPYPGELGQRIFDNISKEAWKTWLTEQTILINEHRLNVLDPESRKLLEDSMAKFLFEEA